MESVSRAKEFIGSQEYNDLKKDLELRVSKVQREIAIAASIDNVNMRGRIIEFLITDNGSDLKKQIIDALNKGEALPKFKTEDKLGDYSKEYRNYRVETDIKTKVLFLDGNPKAYNIDKILEFLVSPKSVYMIYLIGIENDKRIIVRLCSFIDKRLIKATNIQHHWAGRNTRGVTQFTGTFLKEILESENVPLIETQEAYDFINKLIAL